MKVRSSPPGKVGDSSVRGQRQGTVKGQREERPSQRETGDHGRTGRALEAQAGESEADKELRRRGWQTRGGFSPGGVEGFKQGGGAGLWAERSPGFRVENGWQGQG